MTRLRVLTVLLALVVASCGSQSGPEAGVQDQTLGSGQPSSDDVGEGILASPGSFADFSVLDTCSDDLPRDAIVAPKSVPSRFTVTGAWYEVAAVELQSSISDAAVSAGPEPFLQLSKGAELLEAGRVVWQKKAFTGVSLQLRPEAVARLSTLNDRDLFIGIGDSLEGARIGMVLWAEENGSVGVAGTCDDDNVAAFLMGFAASQPTKETAEILLELVQDPDNASKQLSDWRYPEAVAWQDRDPSVRQIDPDYTPLEILGALTMVGIDVDVPKEWRTGLVLCTRTRLAWNDCWTLSDDEGPVPVFLLAYVDEVSHSALEFWILDEDVNLAEPLLKLGEVPLEAGTSNLAVRIDPQAGKSLDSLVAEGQHLDAISLVNR